jgi:chromosome segregation ATPase
VWGGRDIIGFVALWRERSRQGIDARREEMNVAVGGKEEVSAYRSPTRVLADWFRKSRDNWKQKYMDLQAELKRFKVRAYDLEKSREHWKEQAVAHQQQIAALQAQVEQLQAQVSEVEADSAVKKGVLATVTRAR